MGVFHVFKIVQIAPNQAKRRICFLSLFLMHPTNENLSIMKLATWKKSWTHKIRDFRPTKYWREQFWTHKIPTRKNFGLTKYPWEKFGPAKYLREKISDPRNTHERHDGIRIARSTMTGDPKKPQHTRFCSRNIKFYLTS